MTSWLLAAALLVSASACGTRGKPKTAAPLRSSPKANGLLAFGRWGDVYGPVFVIRVDGTGLRKLTDRGTDAQGYTLEDGFPAWSPDGNELAFLRGRNLINFPTPSRADVYVVDVNGGAPRRLTNGLVTMNFTWSPDGEKIAYAAQPVSGKEATRVYVMNADGSGKRMLTKKISDWPAWSPDGRRVAFAGLSSSLEQANVYAVNIDGGNEVQLTRGGDYAESLAWSPDGSKIAFREAQAKAIAVVDADGGDRHRLTKEGKASAETGSGAPAVGPYWSPDGKRITFGGAGGRIYVVNADGSGLRAITQGADYVGGLTWSPDGKEIAYVRDTLGIVGPSEQDIHVVNVDGSGDLRLRKSIDEVGLSWQPVPRQ